MIFKKLKENYYTFKIRTKEFVVEFLDDETVELYEYLNPTESGFIFDSKKEFNFFLNAITDIVEDSE